MIWPFRHHRDPEFDRRIQKQERRLEETSREIENCKPAVDAAVKRARSAKQRREQIIAQNHFDALFMADLRRNR